MEPGALIASGRDGDIFEYGPGRVLRKTRDGRSIEHEARIMRYAADHGYPALSPLDSASLATILLRFIYRLKETS